MIMAKNSLFFAALLCFSPLVAHAQTSSVSEASFTFLATIVALLFIASMIIFVRIWQSSNDIKALKAKICNKGLAEKSIMRSEVMKLHLLDKDDEAQEILNDALFNEARRLYISTNDSKDYKGMVYAQTDDGSKKVSCDDFFDIKWKKTLEKYQPLYEAVGRKVPDGLKNVTYQYVKGFGKDN